MLLFPAPRLYEDSAPDFIAQISNVVIVATTLYSGAEYFIKNRDVFKNAK